MTHSTDRTGRRERVEGRLFIALVTDTYPPQINGVAMTLKRLVDGLNQKNCRVQVALARQDQRDVGSEERMFPSLPVPGYPGLRFGIPARRQFARQWSQDTPDLVHVATESPFGWSAATAARSLRIPVTSSFHTNFHQYLRHYHGVGLRSVALAYLKWFHNRTAATFVPTDEVRNELRSEGFQNLKLLERGVDARLFSPDRRSAELRASWGATDDTVVLLGVGRLAAEKNIQLTLDAFRHIRRTVSRSRLVLVGDGPLRQPLQTEHGDVVFSGARQGEDLARHFASADVFLFPSQTDTFGNVVLEAMASGLTLIAFDYAAAHRHLRHGQNALLAPLDEPQVFLDLTGCAVHSPELRCLLGGRARQVALTLTWDAVVGQFHEDLMEIVRPQKWSSPQGRSAALASEPHRLMPRHAAAPLPHSDSTSPSTHL